MTPDEYRHHRLWLKLSHAKMAELLRVSRSTSSRWEAGESPIPRRAAKMLKNVIFHPFKPQ